MAIVTTPAGVVTGVGVATGVSVGVGSGVGVGVGVVSITKSGLGVGRRAVSGCSFGEATTVIAPAISTTIMSRKRMVVRLMYLISLPLAGRAGEGVRQARTPELQSADCIGPSSTGQYWDR